MTDNSTGAAAKPALTPFQADMQRILADVSKNPALIEFPRDQWGMTTAMRRHSLQAAGSIRGDRDKLEVFLGTLQVLAKHVQARLADDMAAREARSREVADQYKNERVYARTVPAAPTAPAVPS